LSKLEKNIKIPKKLMTLPKNMVACKTNIGFKIVDTSESANASSIVHPGDVLCFGQDGKIKSLVIGTGLDDIDGELRIFMYDGHSQSIVTYGYEKLEYFKELIEDGFIKIIRKQKKLF
jgi:hypothetical protein